jgi:hypothetical protein
MESDASLNYGYIINKQDFTTMVYRNRSTIEKVKNNTIFEKLAVEGFEDFFNYIEWLGLANDPNLLILPSSRHFYYDAEDFKMVKTLVNLKQLNYIKQIDEFLHSLYHLLPMNSYFIGSFIGRRNHNSILPDQPDFQPQFDEKFDPVENGIESRIPFVNMIYNLIDARTYRHMTKKTVTLLLEDVGLKVLDMTEFKGLTYFCTQLTGPYPKQK